MDMDMYMDRLTEFCAVRARQKSKSKLENLYRGLHWAVGWVLFVASRNENCDHRTPRVLSWTNLTEMWIETVQCWSVADGWTEDVGTWHLSGWTGCTEHNLSKNCPEGCNLCQWWGEMGTFSVWFCICWWSCILKCFIQSFSDCVHSKEACNLLLLLELEESPLTVKSDMATIVKVMQLPDSGLEIRDRMWLKITISNAVIGEHNWSLTTACKLIWMFLSLPFLFSF